MATLYNGDCFDSMKLMDDKSVDLIFCDLPYGQTSCKWDCLIDLDKLWIEFMRIKKLNTPIIMTCTTKFGLSLLNSCPKKCPFRYDLVWCKSASAGFLCAKKMPMRKHEMIYVFYEKLPFYDLSSHQHKFINTKIVNDNILKDTKYGTNTYNTETGRKQPLKHTGSGAFGGEGPCYDPPLPNSLIKDEQFKIDISKDGAYGNNINIINPKHRKDKYKSPLPTSLIKEDNCPEPEPENKSYTQYKARNTGGNYDNKHAYQDDLLLMGKEWKKKSGGTKIYDPPLPTSLIKEDCPEPEIKDVYNATERFKNGKLTKHARNLQKGDDPIYDPPLPTSLIKEGLDTKIYETKERKKPLKQMGTATGNLGYDPPLPNSLIKEEHDWVIPQNTELYGKAPTENNVKLGGHQKRYDPPLPNSLIKEDCPEPEPETMDTIYGEIDIKKLDIERKDRTSAYDPALPNSLLEIKSTRGKHSTEKPVALMEWILKYYSKEDDIVFDPTMGSGSMGVACGNMNRNFIGIEKDAEIYQVAVNRIEE